jgi:hypothetical protein
MSVYKLVSRLMLHSAYSLGSKINVSGMLEMVL